MAGTAVPDWLSYIDRKVRARKKLAEPLVTDVDPQIAAVARGIVQHHIDDARFHGCRRFVELSMQFAVEIRERLSSRDDLRSSLVGHILVELLLDWHVQLVYPGRLEAYYQALSTVNPVVVQAAVNRIAKKPTYQIVDVIPQFLRIRFLFDYADDELLVHRLNQVLHRVGLERLPDSMVEYVGLCRPQVRHAAPAMLAVVSAAKVVPPR